MSKYADVPPVLPAVSRSFLWVRSTNGEMHVLNPAKIIGCRFCSPITDAGKPTTWIFLEGLRIETFTSLVEFVDAWETAVNDE